MSEILVNYNGAIIHYVESRNLWTVNLDGARINDKESLAKAREAVDRFQAREKDSAVKFGRCEAWLFRQWTSIPPEKVTVTSLTECGKEAWIIRASKSRSKEYLTNLYAADASNDALVETSLRLNAEADILNARAIEKWKGLTKFVVSAA